MIATLFFIVFALGFSLVFASRPAVLICAAILLRLFLPSYQSAVWFTGLHPAGYLIMAAALVQMIFYWPRVVHVLRKSVIEIFGFALFCGLIMANVLSIFNSLTDSAINIAVVYLPPFVLFLMLKMQVLRTGMAGLRRIVMVMHLAMLVQMYMAIRQNVTGQIGVFEKAAKETLWQLRGVDTINRSQGFLETGLEFSALCSLLVALTIFVRNAALRTALICLYAYGVVLGNGRAALIIAVVTGVAVILLSRGGLLSKALSSGGSVLAGLWMAGTQAGELLSGKIENDGGSADLRRLAYVWVSKHWQEFIYTGYPGNRDFRESGVLRSSLENSYLIVGADYGLVAAGVLLVLQLFAAVRNMRSALGVVCAVGALGMIANNLTNSGFTANQASAYLIWAALGIASIGRYASDYGYVGYRPSRWRRRRLRARAQGRLRQRLAGSQRAMEKVSLGGHEQR